MIRITTFAGRKVAVFGLGLSGRASVAALVAGGAQVAAWDDGEAGREAAQAAGITLSDLHNADWGEFSALVLAPGVPLTHPEPHWTVKRAQDAGVEIIGDTELFFRERAKLCPASKVVTITGTNGKSTTTALIAHVLSSSGRDVAMGGNIGVPILALEPPVHKRIYVLEMSSYQIDLTPSLRSDVGILLNISPDHLDRHGNIENYAAIKARVPLEAGHALVGVGDDFVRSISSARIKTGKPLWWISGDASASGVFVDDNRVLLREQVCDRAEQLASIAGIVTLRGTHNAQNAAAATGAARLLGLTNDELQRGFDSFPGLAHRMEIVGRRGHVLFVNDSKGTNADAAAKALATFNDIHWIAGGLAKDGGIEPLAHLFPRIAKAYLIGQAAPDFAQTLTRQTQGAAPETLPPFELCDTLELAVAAAARDATASKAAEPVVLLSPACASFDQFPSFEKRGDRFRDLITALPGIALNSTGDT